MILSGVELTQVYEPDAAGNYPCMDEGRVPSLGTIVWIQNKAYKFVKYSDGTGNLDLVAGDVVYYVDDTGYTAHTVTADVSDSTGAEVGAGVVMATVTTDLSLMWIQIKGAATVSVTPEDSAGDGEPLTCVGAGDKALTRAKEADSTGVYKSVVAYAQDASAKEIICDFPF